MPLNPRLTSRPAFTLGQAVTTALSPDGSRLLVLTGGHNKDRPGRREDFPEFVFIFGVTVYPPRQMQALPVPNSFCGLVWNPAGDQFYVLGGVDDAVYIFDRQGSVFSRTGSIALAHVTGNGPLSNGGGSREFHLAKTHGGGHCRQPIGKCRRDCEFLQRLSQHCGWEEMKNQCRTRFASRRSRSEQGWRTRRGISVLGCRSGRESRVRFEPARRD